MYFHLYYRTSAYQAASHYFFDQISSIIDFLNHPNQRWGLEWQTVVVIEINTNKHLPFYIDGHATACDSFAINKRGELKPLNQFCAVQDVP